MGLFNAVVCFHSPSNLVIALSLDCQLGCQALNLVHSPPNTSWGWQGFLTLLLLMFEKQMGRFRKCTWWDFTLIYLALMGLFNAVVCFHSPSKLVIALSLDCQLGCQALNLVHSPPNTSWGWQGFVTLLLLLFEKQIGRFRKNTWWDLKL